MVFPPGAGQIPALFVLVRSSRNGIKANCPRRTTQMDLPILKNQLIQAFLKICRVGGEEPHPFARGWMNELQRLCMEGRPGDQDRFRRAI